MNLRVFQQTTRRMGGEKRAADAVFLCSPDEGANSFGGFPH